jgi:hypothetical protein
MSELLYEPFAELFAVVLYGAVASLLTVIGVLAEHAGLQNLSAGHSTIGMWEAGFGALLLFAAANVAYDLVLPRLRDRVAN